jgi:hypothetical protein
VAIEDLIQIMFQVHGLCKLSILGGGTANASWKASDDALQSGLVPMERYSDDLAAQRTDAWTIQNQTKKRVHGAR